MLRYLQMPFHMKRNNSPFLLWQQEIHIFFVILKQILSNSRTLQAFQDIKTTLLYLITVRHISFRIIPTNYSSAVVIQTVSQLIGFLSVPHWSMLPKSRACNSNLKSITGCIAMDRNKNCFRSLIFIHSSLQRSDKGNHLFPLSRPVPHQYLIYAIQNTTRPAISRYKSILNLPSGEHHWSIATVTVINQYFHIFPLLSSSFSGILSIIVQKA